MTLPNNQQGQPQDANKDKPVDGAGDQNPQGTPNPPSNDPNAGDVSFTPEQQKFLNKLINRAKDEGREAAKKQHDEEQRKATEEAERKQLAEQQKFKELSEKQQSDLTTLTTQVETHKQTIADLTAERDRYKAIVEANVKEQRKNLPEHLGALLDALDPIAQMEWLSKNADKLTATPGIGTPRRPNGTAQPPAKAQPDNEPRKPLFKL